MSLNALFTASTMRYAESTRNTYSMVPRPPVWSAPTLSVIRTRPSVSTDAETASAPASSVETRNRVTGPVYAATLRFVTTSAADTFCLRQATLRPGNRTPRHVATARTPSSQTRIPSTSRRRRCRRGTAPTRNSRYAQVFCSLKRGAPPARGQLRPHVRHCTGCLALRQGLHGHRRCGTVVESIAHQVWKGTSG